MIHFLSSICLLVSFWKLCQCHWMQMCFDLVLLSLQLYLSQFFFEDCQISAAARMFMLCIKTQQQSQISARFPGSHWCVMCITVDGGKKYNTENSFFFLLLLKSSPLGCHLRISQHLNRAKTNWNRGYHEQALVNVEVGVVEAAPMLGWLSRRRPSALLLLAAPRQSWTPEMAVKCHSDGIETPR